MSRAAAQQVFLIDVDNTLLDNDRFLSELHALLLHTVGADDSARYWETLETLRGELGYVDYLGALQRLRRPGVNDTALLEVSRWLLEFPFAEHAYARAQQVLHHLRAAGPVVILSDGDVVFQPHKIRCSGLWDAVEGRVLVYVHKEQMLEQVEQAYPAHHYVMIDDKLRILAAIKDSWGERVTTVFLRQGHYGRDSEANAAYRAADLSFDTVGELLAYQPAGAHVSQAGSTPAASAGPTAAAGTAPAAPAAPRRTAHDGAQHTANVDAPAAAPATYRPAPGAPPSQQASLELDDPSPPPPRVP
jgi:FMN phosphatase YigB (HAD superfamily)